MKRAIPLLLICFIGFFWKSTYAQTSRDLEEIISDTIAYQQPILVSEIVSYEQETKAFMDQIQNGINKRNDFKDIEDGLFQVDSLMGAKSPISKEFLENAGPISLQNQITEWETYKTELTKWSTDLRGHATWFETQQELVAHLRILWQESRVSAAEADAPSEVLSRIRTLIRSIHQLEDQLNTGRNSILQKDVKIADMLSITHDDLGVMNEVKEEAVESLTIIESPPIWTFFTESESESESEPDEEVEEDEDEDEDVEVLSFGESLKTLVNKRIATILAFYKSNKFSLILGILSLLVFYSFTHYLKKKSTEWNETYKSKRLKEPVKSSTELILKDRLISVSLLLALVFIALIFPNRPFVVDELLVLIAIFPLVSVIDAFAPDELKFSSLISIPFFIGHINSLIIELQLSNRIILLFISVSLALILAIVIRRKMFAVFTNGFIKSLVSILVWLALVAQIVATVSNVLGNVTLANYLVYGFLDLYFISILVYAVTTIFINITHLVMRSPALQGLYMVQKHEFSILSRIKNTYILIAVIVWLKHSTQAFKVKEVLINSIGDFLFASITIGSFVFSLGDILIFFLVIWISIIISKSVRFLLDEEVFPRTKIKRGTSATISTFVRVSIITLGFILAIAASGFPLDRLTILIGAFGVGIGFGLQNIFNNLVSGFIIATERPMEVGDTIEVGTLVGEVREIGIRSSLIRTFDGSEVIVPNGNIISNELINWTHSDQQRRLKIRVGVAYGSDIHRVIEVLTNLKESDKRILGNPEPYILFKGFGDSSLDFEFRCWTSSDDWYILESDLAIKVHDALKENGIEIPFPQRDLHLRTVDNEIIKQTKQIPPGNKEK